MTEQAPRPRKTRADGVRGTRHVFVRGLVVDANVGIHDHEKKAPQRLVISVELTASESPQGHDDKIKNVVCYEGIVAGIKDICGDGHVNLIETLAERIAKMCLEDDRVLAVGVRVEKPGAFADCGTVGVEIERLRSAG